MQGYQQPSGGQPGNTSPVADPRMQPTPDYGTLGPGSDVSVTGADPIQRTPRGTGMQTAHLIAILAGLLGFGIAVAERGTVVVVVVGGGG